jgi:solute carrier family 39 (zinc transporter), member 7
VVIAAAVLLMLLSLPTPCNAHEHLKPAAYRYSKEANTQPEKASGHSHDGHAGHSHGGHSHDHGHAHDHGHVHDHGHDHSGHSHGGHDHHPHKEEQVQDKEEPPRDTKQIWLEALGATVLISAAPFFILFLVPLDNSKEREPLLKVCWQKYFSCSKFSNLNFYSFCRCCLRSPQVVCLETLSST